jgi:hypothetical protein
MSTIGHIEVHFRLRRAWWFNPFFWLLRTFPLFFLFILSADSIRLIAQHGLKPEVVTK